jgi:hypothetical protein
MTLDITVAFHISAALVTPLVYLVISMYMLWHEERLWEIQCTPNTMQASPILFQMWVLLYHTAIFRHRFRGYGVTSSGSEQESLAGSSQYGNEP